MGGVGLGLLQRSWRGVGGGPWGTEAFPQVSWPQESGGRSAGLSSVCSNPAKPAGTCLAGCKAPGTSVLPLRGSGVRQGPQRHFHCWAPPWTEPPSRSAWGPYPGTV